MAEIDRDLQFGRVLESGSKSWRSLLIVLPVVVVVVLIVGFGAVAISRMSALSSEIQVAKKQAEESQKAADEHDQKLREARAEAGILGSAGQGAAVLVAASPDSGASGVAIFHPETNAMNIYAYNLSPAPEGKDYRVIVRDASGVEKDAAGVKPDDRGSAFVLARDLPEGTTHVELALVPTAGQQAKPQGDHGQQGQQAQNPGQQASAQQMVNRQIVIAGDLPKPGEAGVIAAAKSDEGQQGKAKAPQTQAQGRRGKR
jgi:hypothetical protein